MLTGVLAFILLLVVLAGIGHFVGPYILDYRVTPTAIEFLAFSVLPLGRIPVNELIEVREIGIRETGPWHGLRFFLALRLGNRWARRGVMLTKARGLFRVILVTPGDPGKFVEAVRSNMRALGRP